MDQAAQYAVETDEASFDRDVIQSSFEHLVLVDFWAAWCGPCRSLSPILDKLLVAYSGSVHLAKVNTDEQQQLAARYGVRSLPTIFLFKDGEAVDQFMGVQPESEIRRFIDKYIVRESDKQLDKATGLYGQGNVEEAIALLQRAIPDDPDNDRPKFVLIGWLAEQTRFEDAKAVLGSISTEGRNDTRYAQLAARIDFGTQANTAQSIEELAQSIAQDGNNLEARFELAGQLVQGDKLTEALDQLLEIIKRDRSFRKDQPRQHILKIFDLAGGKGEIVNQYRRQLARVLN